MPGDCRNSCPWRAKLGGDRGGIVRVLQLQAPGAEQGFVMSDEAVLVSLCTP